MSKRLMFSRYVTVSMLALGLLSEASADQTCGSLPYPKTSVDTFRQKQASCIRRVGPKQADKCKLDCEPYCVSHLEGTT